MPPMALAHRTRRRLYMWAIYTLVGGAIGAVYSLFIGGHPKFGFPIGCAIVGGVMGFELLFVQQPVGAWLRGLSFHPDLDSDHCCEFADRSPTPWRGGSVRGAFPREHLSARHGVLAGGGICDERRTAHT